MKIVFVFLVLICSKWTFAQSKIGIVDSQSLLERLPSRDSVIRTIKAKEASYLKELNSMDSVLNAFVSNIGCGGKEYVSELREKTTNYLRESQEKIQQREQEMDREIQRLASECNERSLEIIREAVKKVSLNLGLNVVLDATQLMYFTDELNITGLVFTEMIKIDQSTE